VLTIVLTRHGLTPRSVPEQHLGQGIDVGLSAEGESAAVALRARLAGVSFDRIVSSPLERALRTATVLAAGRDIETDERLLEMDYGEWEGLTYEQIDARDPDVRRRWVADPAASTCPGGESGDDVAARVRSFVSDAIATARDAAGTGASEARILFVGHATLNRVLLCVALGVPVRDYRRRFRQDPANLTVLRFPDGLQAGALLVVDNDTSHLGGSLRRLLAEA
jgi:broad specificity phosphatase PhoE